MKLFSPAGRYFLFIVLILIWVTTPAWLGGRLPYYSGELFFVGFVGLGLLKWVLCRCPKCDLPVTARYNAHGPNSEAALPAARCTQCQTDLWK